MYFCKGNQAQQGRVECPVKSGISGKAVLRIYRVMGGMLGSGWLGRGWLYVGVKGGVL